MVCVVFSAARLEATVFAMAGTGSNSCSTLVVTRHTSYLHVPSLLASGDTQIANLFATLSTTNPGVCLVWFGLWILVITEHGADRPP